jgi:hypothetical protein
MVEWLSFALVGLVALAIGARLGSVRELRTVRHVILAGVGLRIIGVFARYAMIFDLYGGSSDAISYFQAGRDIADHLHVLDFSFLGSGQPGEHEWGTQAMRYASGFIIAIVGPSMRGAFLAFSVAAFAGVICVILAFARANTSAPLKRCALLLCCWPTLWFWPSSIGKEAVLLLAVGLITLGYVGRRERIRWVPLLAGLALALAIRPHLAGVLAISISGAEWFSRAWSARRLSQSVLATAVTVGLLVTALNFLGLSGAGLGALRNFVRDTAERTDQGGSAFVRAASPVVAIPMAFVNTLVRPLPFEAHNPMAFMASLEMMGFWALVIRSRRRFRCALRLWRTNRLLRFATLFALLYVLMIGVTFQNLGIIARQRALVMPALLLLLATTPSDPVPHRRAAPVRRAWPRRTPRPFAEPVRP